METNNRSTQRRARWLAVAVAIGFSAPAAGQVGDDYRMLPSRPLPPAKMAAWPEFPPLDPPGSISPERKDESTVKPAASRGGVIPAASHQPPFSGFGAAKPEFPQPDPPPSSLADGAAPAKVWNVAPASTPTSPPAPAERSPREFGSGWKGVVNQKVLGREAPAAGLAAPRSIVPRPEWSWHGYDAYNQNRAIASELNQPPSPENAAELAPFMKYAHRWKPSSINTAYARQPGLASTSVTDPVFPPAAAFEKSMNPAGSATPPLTPSVTVPLEGTGAPDLIQPTVFRAPAQPEPARPKVLVLPGSGLADRLPLSVRERVSATCAGKCRNLAVDMTSPTRLTIRFLVKDPIEAEMLTNMLGALPELSAYKVEFEVQIGQ